jgi:hypothetical protein
VAESVQYKKPRKVNIVVIAILGGLAFLVYLAWIYLPLYFRKAETVRILDETSSEFMGMSSRMLADDKLVDKMLRDMRGEIQALGISDPQAEYWIEIDSEVQVRFGVLYSDWIQLPFLDAKEVVNELEMFCTRPGRGMEWKCEARELDSAALGDELPAAE